MSYQAAVDIRDALRRVQAGTTAPGRIELPRLGVIATVTVAPSGTRFFHLTETARRLLSDAGFLPWSGL